MHMLSFPSLHKFSHEKMSENCSFRIRLKSRGEGEGLGTPDYRLMVDDVVTTEHQEIDPVGEGSRVGSGRYC